MNSFMLTNEFLDSFVVSPSNNIGVSKDTKEHRKKRLQEEIKTNTLFWCLYNIVFNKSDNDMIKNRFTEEKRIKYEWVLKLQSKKPLYKKHYKSEPYFSVHSDFSIGATHAVCELFSLSLTIIVDKTYIHFNYGENHHIIEYNTETNTFSPSTNLIKHNIENLSISYLHIVDYHKMLYALSYYKINELKRFMNQLGMHTDSSLKKKDMYDIIKNKIKLTYLKINV